MSTDGTTPAVYTIAEACAAARIGRSTLYKHIGTGDLRAIKIGSRTCVPIDELYRWLNAMPSSVPVLRSSSEMRAVKAQVRKRALTCPAVVQHSATTPPPSRRSASAQ